VERVFNVYTYTYTTNKYIHEIMKCTLLKEIFEDCLALSSKFVSYRVSSVQSIQGAKLETKKNTLTITTTNLGDSFYTEISAHVLEEGMVVFDLKKALEFLNFLPLGEIEISLEDTQVKISQGKTHGYFNIYPVGDFPELPILEGKTFPLNQQLLEKLPQVYFAASKDETRPVMTGVYMNALNESSLFVSTDGFRLSLLKVNLQEKFPKTILPATIFQEIVRLSKRGDAVSMMLSPEDRLVKFTIGKVLIYSRVIEGDFPPYEKVVPKSTGTSITLDPHDFLKNIRLISVFARDDADVVVFDIAKKGMVMKPKAARQKNSEVFQNVESFSGDQLKIAFNYKYILDFLNTVSADQIILECTTPTAPGVFKVSNNEEFLHIIMPLRTEETTE